MDWKYLAGFFDGEGHVGIHKGRGKWLSFEISVANTHQPTMLEMSRFLNVCGIKHSAFTVKVKERWKPVYKIRVTGIINATMFLENIRPHLITKLDAADRVLDFLGTKTPRDAWSEKSYERAISEYLSGKSWRQAAKVVGMDDKSLRMYARKKGIKSHSPKVSRSSNLEQLASHRP